MRTNIIHEYRQLRQKSIEQVRRETFAMLDTDLHGRVHDELYIETLSANDKETLLDVQSTIKAIAMAQEITEVEY